MKKTNNNKPDFKARSIPSPEEIEAQTKLLRDRHLELKAAQKTTKRKPISDGRRCKVTHAKANLRTS